MDADLIWITDAVDAYERSRSWLDQQLNAGNLTQVKIPGDKRVYLKRSELDSLLKPREIKRDGDSSNRNAG